MEAFYSEWLLEKHNLLMDLLSVPENRPDLHIPLISRVLSHYAEYDDRKSQLGNRDIFQVFSACWLTPFERSFLWLGGMKPCTLFHFVPSDLADGHKRDQVEHLRQKTVERMIELTEVMQQAEDALTVLMALAVTHGHVRNGEARGDTVLRVSEMMCTVFDEAEKLRRHVVTRIIEIIGSAPTVQFFVSLANHHLWWRHLGLLSLQSVAQIG